MWSWALLLSSSARKKRRRGERWTKGAEREMPYACTHWKQMAKWLSRPPVLFSFLAAQWFLFISYFIAFLPYTLKDVICVKYCYLHFLLHSSFTLQVLHFSFSCSLFLSRPYLQSLTPWIPQSLETLAVQPNIAHTHRALFEIQVETSKFPKTPHLSGWVLQACTRHPEYFHLIEGRSHENTWSVVLINAFGCLSFTVQNDIWALWHQKAGFTFHPLKGGGLCAVLESRYHIYGHLKPSVYKEQLVLIFSPVKWIFFA